MKKILRFFKKWLLSSKVTIFIQTVLILVLLFIVINQRQTDRHQMLLTKVFNNVVTKGITPPPVSYADGSDERGMFYFQQTDSNNFKTDLKMFLNSNKNIELAPEKSYKKECRAKRVIPQFENETIVGYVVIVQPKESK